MISKVTYLGGLRTSNTHLKSGDSYNTDAPTDNNGKGEAFSPTDTVATGLANCMLTVMGIKAEKMGLDLSGTTADVTKIMAADPRRISRIGVDISFTINPDNKSKKILENTALSCPVIYSLHEDIHKDVTFKWAD